MNKLKKNLMKRKYEIYKFLNGLKTIIEIIGLLIFTNIFVYIFLIYKLSDTLSNKTFFGINVLNVLRELIVHTLIYFFMMMLIYCLLKFLIRFIEDSMSCDKKGE